FCGWLWSRMPGAGNNLRMGKVVVFVLAAGLAAAGFWALFVRTMPAATTFELNFNPKYFAAVLVFPFSPVIVLVAAVGVARAVQSKRLNYLPLLLFLLP